MPGGPSPPTAPASRASLPQVEGLLLAQVIDALPGSLDYDETLTGVAQMAVQSLADFCIIDMVEGDALRRVQVAHADPACAELTRQLMQYPPARGRPHVSLHALETRAAIVIREVDRSLLDAQSYDAEHLRILDALGPHSLMAVPLLIAGEPVGVMLLASSSRTYGDDDLAHASDPGALRGSGDRACGPLPRVAASRGGARSRAPRGRARPAQPVERDRHDRGVPAGARAGRQ